MSDRNVGWALVGVQTILLVTLIVLPTRSDWPTSAPIEVGGVVLIAGGVGLVAVAASRLGSSLTPTPVPRDGGALTTTGLYGLVRHPIYTGVLAAVGGVTLRSGSLVVTSTAAVTVAFFSAKARWEERRLALRYADYESYAASVPRFVPRLTR